MVNNVNAQIWLDEKYPKDGICKRDNDPENKEKRRIDITVLDIRKEKIGSKLFKKDKVLVGSLKLEGFANLRTLIISSHKIIGLDLSDCPNLEKLNCQNNQLDGAGIESLKKSLPYPEKLTEVNVSDSLQEQEEFNA